MYFNIITTYLSLDAKSENVPPDVTTFLGAPLQEVLPYQERQAVNNFLCRRGKFPIAQGFKVSKFLRIQQRGHVFQSMALSRHWEGIFNDHLPMATKVETEEEIVAIDVNAIRRKNVLVEVGSSTFVSVILNLLESD